MRRAEAHAENTGDLGIVEDDALAVEETARGGMSVFFLPIIAMVFFTCFRASIYCGVSSPGFW